MKPKKSTSVIYNPINQIAPPYLHTSAISTAKPVMGSATPSFSYVRDTGALWFVLVLTLIVSVEYLKQKNTTK